MIAHLLLRMNVDTALAITGYERLVFGESSVNKQESTNGDSLKTMTPYSATKC